VLGLWYWSAAFGTGVAATLGAVLVWYFFLIHSVAFAIPRMLLPVSPLLWVGAVGSIYSFLVLKRMRVILLGLGVISLMAFGFIVSGDWSKYSDLVSENSRKYFSTVREFNINEGNLHSLKITGEFLEVDGRNPFIEFPNLDIPLEKNQVLYLDIATSLSSYSTGRFRWATADQSLSVDSMENFTLPSGADWHTVRISPSLNSNWKGRMRTLRLRLSGPIGTRYQISTISLRK